MLIRFLFLLLMFPACLMSVISFDGGNWETGTFTGERDHFSSTAFDSSYCMQIVTNPVRRGTYALRVEVRPGNYSLVDGSFMSGERSELGHPVDSDGNEMWEAESSGTKYFAFSFKMDSSWHSPVVEPFPPGNLWACILQVHPPYQFHNSSPSFGINVVRHNVGLDSGRSVLNVQIRGGNYASPVDGINRYVGIFNLPDSSLQLGHWVDLMIKIKFSKSFDGSVTVWRRNQGETFFNQQLDVQNVPTLFWCDTGEAVPDHSWWQMGMYRSKSCTSTVHCNTPGVGNTSILWNDCFIRGESFEEVDSAAFGKIDSSRCE